MNKLPDDIKNKIQLYLSHPCADMLEAEMEYCACCSHEDFETYVLREYRESHPKIKFHGMFAEVMNQFEEQKEYVRRNNYCRPYVDWMRLLEVLRLNMRGSGCPRWCHKMHSVDRKIKNKK